MRIFIVNTEHWYLNIHLVSTRYLYPLLPQNLITGSSVPSHQGPTVSHTLLVVECSCSAFFFNITIYFG